MMSLSASSKFKGTDIRAGLNHPVVDADGHVVEATPVILDFIKQVAGREMADRYIQFTQSFIRPNAPRKSFWLAPSGPNTIDRATAMLPRLFRARLDDAGIDVSLVYTSQGLSVAQIPDAELRIPSTHLSSKSLLLCAGIIIETNISITPQFFSKPFFLQSYIWVTFE